MMKSDFFALILMLGVSEIEAGKWLGQASRIRPGPLPIPARVMKDFVANAPTGEGKSTDDGNVKYLTDYYDAMPVDHLGFGTTETFKLKYLYNNASYSAGGPLFFYCGNEGSIEGFAENTGIMFDLAANFNAFILFGEHRYYGTSLPFNDSQQTFKYVAHIGYLTTQQTLLDYVVLLDYIKESFALPADIPVIAFGGSYGGMLAAWFRMKYPSVVTGAWSASAPILYFRNGGIPMGGFDAIVKRTMLASGCSEDVIVKAFGAVATLGSDATGIKSLNEIFVIDPKSRLTSMDDVQSLLYYIREALEYMVMTDYPYPTAFLTPMPAWPVEEACKFLATAPNDLKALATQLHQAISIFYNYTGKLATACVIGSKCGDQATANLGIGLSWPFQACTEMVMPICAQGPPNDLFWKDCGEDDVVELTTKGCVQDLASLQGFSEKMVHFDAIGQEYGFSLAGISNIIFTNGLYDPWSVGGVTENSTAKGMNEHSQRGIFTYELEGSAHHLDLRQPNTCDPPNVVEARRQIVAILKCWVGSDEKWCPRDERDLSLLQLNQPLPAFEKVNDKAEGGCQAIVGGYPWTDKKDDKGNGASGVVKQGMLWAGLAFVVACLLLA